MPLFLGSTKVALNMGDRIGENANNQSKSVTPTQSTQTVTPDPGYTGLSQVTVNAIPNSYLIPNGTYTVSTYSSSIDITQYSNLIVPRGKANLSASIISSTGQIFVISSNQIGSSFVAGFVNGFYDFTIGNRVLPSTSISHITPSSTSQVAVSQYIWTLNDVVVDAIPNSYIVPSGTYTVSTAGTANITNFSRLEVPGVAYPLVNISAYTNSDHLLISAKYSFQSSGFIGAGAQSYTTMSISGISSTTIIPGSSSQIAVPQDRYTLGSVIVDAIPNEYKIVSGTITYNSVGTYNVTNYSYVNIDLPVYNGSVVY